MTRKFYLPLLLVFSACGGEAPDYTEASIADLPIGVIFVGAASSDKRLIEIAYAFEQASAARRPPQF
jgi:Asp-tRNA(Asn)/Glu-tRNA(Gln) amidotransferase A subunit family amidase